MRRLCFIGDPRRDCSFGCWWEIWLYRPYSRVQKPIEICFLDWYWIFSTAGSYQWDSGLSGWAPSVLIYALWGIENAFVTWIWWQVYDWSFSSRAPNLELELTFSAGADCPATKNNRGMTPALDQWMIAGRGWMYQEEKRMEFYCPQCKWWMPSFIWMK